ncbi:velvet factor-domain-containing protein [Phycomyces nitens]|nr:velvet factor-domain-containing protein [Phycomyces nitens]
MNHSSEPTSTDEGYIPSRQQYYVWDELDMNIYPETSMPQYSMQDFSIPLNQDLGQTSTQAQSQPVYQCPPEPQWGNSHMITKKTNNIETMVSQFPFYSSAQLAADVQMQDTNPRAYYLDIVEQPQQCRMCGFGEKDRRPIDPAPVIHLIVRNQAGFIDQDCMEMPFFVIHASLWSVDMQHQIDVLKGPASVAFRILLGSTVSSPLQLKGLDNNPGTYFSFPELSVRMPGQYRLKFTLIHLTRSSSTTHVFTEPFMVYTAKTFPGMKESSDLAKHLARQGLKLPVRNLARGNNKRDNEDKDNIES